MEQLLGLVIALVLGWLCIKLGAWLQKRGYGFSRTGAIAIGVAVGLGLWLLLSYTTKLPQPLVTGIALGPAIGLSQGLRRPEAEKK